MPVSRVSGDAAGPDETSGSHQFAATDGTASPGTARTEDTAAGTEAASNEPASDEAAGFENRAARRARGKGTRQQQPHGKAKHFDGRGSVQGPRQWGNRRSG